MPKGGIREAWISALSDEFSRVDFPLALQIWKSGDAYISCSPVEGIVSGGILFRNDDNYLFSIGFYFPTTFSCKEEYLPNNSFLNFLLREELFPIFHQLREPEISSSIRYSMSLLSRVNDDHFSYYLYLNIESFVKVTTNIYPAVLRR